MGQVLPLSLIGCGEKLREAAVVVAHGIEVDHVVHGIILRFATGRRSPRREWTGLPAPTRSDDTAPLGALGAMG